MLPRRKRLRPIDLRYMNESTKAPVPDSVIGNENLDLSLNFESTLATEKRCVLLETPKSQTLK